MISDQDTVLACIVQRLNVAADGFRRELFRPGDGVGDDRCLRLEHTCLGVKHQILGHQYRISVQQDENGGDNDDIG